MSQLGTLYTWGKELAWCLLVSLCILFPANADKFKPRVRNPKGVFLYPLIRDDITSEFWEIDDRFRKIAVFSANFQQLKSIKMLKRPLLSKGKFIFAKKNGLYWKINHPFSSTTVITADGIFEEQSNGQMKEVAKQAKPVVKAFSEAFLSVFSGDYSVLSKHFTIFFRVKKKGWEIGLQPLQSQMKKSIHQIVIKGDHLIESMRIFEANGDVTAVEFAETKIAKTLSPEEQKYFEFGE